jgi:hypothetical protein
MSRQLPYLAMDDILCDRPQDGCFIGISRKERGYARDDTSKEKRVARKMLSNDQLSHYVGMSIKNPIAANRYWAKCMGQDAAMDDETVEKLKGFLKNKLSAEDHEQVCNMLDGDDEAQDEPPFPTDPDAEPIGKLAGDESFRKQFPDASRIRIDNSGMQPRGRATSFSAAGAKSFAEMFPDAARIRLL